MIDDSRRGWIEDLARDLGEEARWRLIAARGGLDVTPPQPENAASSLLVAEIGLDAALWLAERFAGERLHIPNMGVIARAEARRRRDFVLDNPDASATDLARATGLTTRRIVQIRAEARKGTARSSETPPLLRLMGL